MKEGRIDSRQRLLHMLEAIAEVQGFVAGVSRAEFDLDHRTLFACVRGVEILGEAARHVADEIKAQYPEINWRGIVDLRNFVVHQYFAIDNEALWLVIHDHMPVLKPQLERVLQALSV
ncbi:DUF86 domain-containing protein [Hymenobacter algoricola]|uniref:DUF86 domain-containing protein n=1 Tax=Hymenobacter algoricola TaxID=486267 RepID=A0ABP7NQX8_9BACT